MNLFVRRVFVIVALGVFLVGWPALAQVTFVETYEEGTNRGDWSWGTGNEEIVSLNGNPGAYLQDLTLSTFTPGASTAPGDFSQFVGNYRGRGVSSVGIDLVILDTGFPIDPSSRPLTLILYNDNGTPQDFEDDWGAWFIGPAPIPSPGVTRFLGAGWNAYDFDVPSQWPDTTTPEGWVFFDCTDPNIDCVITPAGQTPQPSNWQDLMADVDVVEFHYGVPGTISILNSWDVGLDNPRITSQQLAGDLDGNGEVSPLDIQLLPPMFGPCAGACPEDLDGNGVVEPEDLRLLLELIVR